MRVLKTFLLFVLFLQYTCAWGKNDSINIANLVNSIDTMQNSETILVQGKLLLKKTRSNNFNLLEARLLRKLAKQYEYHNLQDTALFYYQQSIILLDSIAKLNPTKHIAILLSSNYNDIAELHANITNIEQAFEYNQKSLIINQQNNLTNRFVNSYITRGKLAYLKEDTQMAKVYWEKGLHYADSVDDNDLTARLLNNLGSIYYHEQNWPVCLWYFRNAYELQKNLNNELELIKAANNVGLIYFMQKQYNNALKFLKEADLLGQKHNVIASQGMTLYYLIQTYMQLNMPDETQDAFIRFQEILDETYSQEKAEKINELEVKYQVEQKNKEIALLEQQKLIDKLKIQRRNWLILVVFFTVIIIAILIWFRFQNYNKQQTIKKQKLEFQKLLIEQKMLRSQMNPHFIYNSLNSIQSFISSEKPYEAEKYLSKFAKLMRAILENSREDFINLEKEIEMLELYVQIEQLGMEHQFTFSINLKDNMESDFINIPPMLIQPFIENSIIHGISTVKNGSILVTFNEKDDYLICEIDDNGIGRKSTIKNQDNKEHKSLATTITKERLETLSEQFNQKAFYTIFDKVNENGDALGTKVTLHIPINIS